MPKGRPVSRIRHFLRQLKAVSTQPHIALLLDADLDFAQSPTPSPQKEAQQ